jgi:hypothetical protein
MARSGTRTETARARRDHGSIGGKWDLLIVWLSESVVRELSNKIRHSIDEYEARAALPDATGWPAIALHTMQPPRSICFRFGLPRSCRILPIWREAC